MSIPLIFSLVGGGAVLVFVWIIVAKLKRAKIDRAENKSYKKNKEKTIKTENKKNKIRKKRSEKATDIIANPNGNNGLMQNVSTDHNHKFRGKCSPDCPAYIKP